MPLAIDSSRAFRRIQELADLVEAVVLADPNDESDWIEWKDGLVLSNKDGIVQLARHILGMANRKVGEAARFAEGCGYVIVGAEPGKCGGVAGIDPADLDSKITTYTGADGPSWSPQYVPCRGVQVLVITVESPRWGQRPFTLRKTLRGLSPWCRVRAAARSDDSGRACRHPGTGGPVRGSQPAVHPPGPARKRRRNRDDSRPAELSIPFRRMGSSAAPRAETRSAASARVPGRRVGHGFPAPSGLRAGCCSRGWLSGHADRARYAYWP